MGFYTHTNTKKNIFVLTGYEKHMMLINCYLLEAAFQKKLKELCRTQKLWASLTIHWTDSTDERNATFLGGLYF